jgi:DMATS type aromatic prenyltransferase
MDPRRGVPAERLALITHVSGQLSRLLAVVGLEEQREIYERLLDELLGASGGWPVGRPRWLSELSDDHSPIEYSLTFGDRCQVRLRVLVEPNEFTPSLTGSRDLGVRVLRNLAQRYKFSLERLDQLADLFLPESPRGPYALWYAAELKPNGIPDFKVYLNPGAQGQDRAMELIGEALGRLGFSGGRGWLSHHVAPRGPQLDRPMFFALDLGHWLHPRVKVYVAHEAVCAAEVGSIAEMAAGVRADAVERFCRQVAGTGPFTARPLISCYTLCDGDAQTPSAYTLHVPVRDYVPDDSVARHLALSAMRCLGCETPTLDAALSALTHRCLASGRGLIAYLAQVFAPHPRRLTVYLSAEANAVLAPMSDRNSVLTT